MGKCYFCDKAERMTWSGYFCTTCDEIQSITKVYGFERMLDIMQTLCLRDQEQLENKLKGLKKKSNITTKDDQDVKY
tara:strand:+ start:252 stop:482 length:231 start_codon:yes stop_codon:yes gene_type:complete